MKRPKKTYLVNEEDLETLEYKKPEEDLFWGESIVESENKVLYFETFKKDQTNALKIMKKKNSVSKKSAKKTAKRISQKYKNLKKPKKTFLVDESDHETITYDEPKKDLFRGESILEAANKALDKFKKQQEATINNFNENLLENSETINYGDNINLDDVKDNKNLKISASKISEKYRKLRKTKTAEWEKQIEGIIEEFKLPKKRKKWQTDKVVLLAAKNMSKKYKNIRFR